MGNMLVIIGYVMVGWFVGDRLYKSIKKSKGVC